MQYSGRDFVVVKFGNIFVFSIYVSPSKPIGYFLEFLDELKRLLFNC